jgi:hypothetical protein
MISLIDYDGWLQSRLHMRPAALLRHHQPKIGLIFTPIDRASQVSFRGGPTFPCAGVSDVTYLIFEGAEEFREAELLSF